MRLAPLTLAALLALSACSASRETATPPGMLEAPAPVAALPEVPEVRGPLGVRLVYPTRFARKPSADSTFVFGNTGTGAASLTINGLPVQVANNGAFLAYVPVASRYRFEARVGGQTDVLDFRYSVPEPSAPAVESFAPRMAIVTGGLDTLATGSQIADGAPSPYADRRWFFPLGTRLLIDGKLARDDRYRVRLTPDTEAWIQGRFLAFDDAPLQGTVGPGRYLEGGRHTDVVLGAAFAPFYVDAQRETVTVTVYGSAVTPNTKNLPARFASVDAERMNDSTRVIIRLNDPLWGFKAFYSDHGDLTIRLRHPPAIDPAEPLRGVRVFVDPGHPPGGATGPTGLTEAEANLAIGLRLAEKLRARGAVVYMTRTGPGTMVPGAGTATELWARVDSAIAWNADLVVSVHNNAFGDGVNPFRRHGSEVYYFHAFTQPFAEALVAAIAPITGIPNLGAKQRSLALVRPSWMPAVLTESMFMMFPQQEAALRAPAFVDRLADAHLTGIEAFLRESARR